MQLHDKNANKMHDCYDCYTKENGSKLRGTNPSITSLFCSQVIHNKILNVLVHCTSIPCYPPSIWEQQLLHVHVYLKLYNMIYKEDSKVCINLMFKL